MINFRWEKLGLIASNLPQTEWSKYYLQFPAVLVLKDKIRIFFTTRPDADKEGKHITYIRYLDLEDLELKKIINFSDSPILSLGKNGEFDQFGTMPGDFLKIGNKIYLYYTGWNRLEAVPYNFSIGLAISEDGGSTFKKYSNGPIMSTSPLNPLSVGSDAVIKEKDIIHMFYISGIKWINVNGKLEHTYDIKHAISSDGFNWDISPGVAISQKNKFEALAAPSIIKIDDIYHMWFSYRGSLDFRDGEDSYKIGYARSTDLYNWDRLDHFAGINISKEGWDSKMICYPYVFKYNSNHYLLYNGNNFGKQSLGLARLIKNE